MENQIKSIATIRELLAYVNLSARQKHEHFHILHFKDDSESIPRDMFFRSDGFFELTVSRQSKTKVQIDDTSFCSENDMINFVSPGQKVIINREGDEKSKEGYVIFFTVDFLHFSPSIYSVIQRFPYFNMHASPMYFLTEQQQEFFMGLMQKIYEKFHAPTEDDFEIIKSYLSILLFEAKTLSNEMIGSFHNRAEEVTYQFENLLKKNTKKRLVKAYADELHISPIYLSECIKSTTGKSAKKIITEYTIREAKSLLLYGDQTVDQIAYDIGFESTSNFINFFKKNVGLTPAKYRKSKA